MTEIIATENDNAAHSSVMGGSTAERRILCPGSLKGEAGKPNEDNEYAQEGTALHSAIEWVLNINTEFLVPTDKDRLTVIGKKFNGVEITRELYNEKLLPALEAFEEIIDKYSIIDYMLEVRGDIPDIPGAFGTIDVLGITETGVLAVIDWKFGDGRFVEVEGSYQLNFYSACALTTENPEIGEFIDENKFNGHILCGIIQPRRGRDGEENYRLTETSEESIFNFIDIAAQAVEIGHSDNPPFRAGEHCWKCKNELTCPEKNKVIGSVDPKIKPDKLTVAELSTQLTWAKTAEAHIKAVRDYAHKEAEKGVKIPGWKLVNKRGSRVYNDRDKAENILKRELKVAGAYTKELISPPQAEKKLGKKKYDSLIKKYVSMVSSGTTLALETDKRDEVTIDIKEKEKLSELTQLSSGSIFDQQVD